jgi:hypothetical protein
MSQFTDALLNSTLRVFGDVLFQNEDGEVPFQTILCQFLALAAQSGWIRDTSILAEWCEKMVASRAISIHHFLIIPYLPVERMPTTAAFLRQLLPRDDLAFNVALVPLLKHFADRGDFGSFFQPQMVFQLIDFLLPPSQGSITPDPLDILFPILSRNLIHTPEFYLSCFEFLLGFGFRRARSLPPKVPDFLALIASKFSDRSSLRAIVAAHCDIDSPVTRTFVRTVIDSDPPDRYQLAAELFFKACLPS